MHADVPNHEPSLMLMNCGEARQARPSVGSWVLYGLGTENQNLPGFVVMCPGGYPIAETQNWQVGVPARRLPGHVHRQPAHRDREADREHPEPRASARRPAAPARPARPSSTGEHLERRQREAELEARIQSFELAFRMQTEAADAFDVSQEPAVDPRHVRRGRPGPAAPDRPAAARARRPLRPGLARRRASRGTATTTSRPSHRKLAGSATRPIAALLNDLKQRGLLDDTLVIWGGEFGRTPTVELPTPGSNQGKMNGRDHNHYGFTMWLAGGGVKGGHVHGATDEFGFQAVEDKVHVHDLHATILHLLGFDHETLHLPLRRPRLPPDRRPRQGGQEDHRLILTRSIVVDLDRANSHCWAGRARP